MPLIQSIPRDMQFLHGTSASHWNGQKRRYGTMYLVFTPATWLACFRRSNRLGSVHPSSAHSLRPTSLFSLVGQSHWVWLAGTAPLIGWQVNTWLPRIFLLSHGSKAALVFGIPFRASSGGIVYFRSPIRVTCCNTTPHTFKAYFSQPHNHHVGT